MILTSVPPTSQMTSASGNRCSAAFACATVSTIATSAPRMSLQQVLAVAGQRQGADPAVAGLVYPAKQRLGIIDRIALREHVGGEEERPVGGEHDRLGRGAAEIAADQYRRILGHMAATDAARRRGSSAVQRRARSACRRNVAETGRNLPRPRSALWLPSFAFTRVALLDPPAELAGALVDPAPSGFRLANLDASERCIVDASDGTSIRWDLGPRRQRHPRCSQSLSRWCLQASCNPLKNRLGPPAAALRAAACCPSSRWRGFAGPRPRTGSR